MFLVRSLMAVAILACVAGGASAQMSRLDSITLRAAGTLLSRVQDARFAVDSALQPFGGFLPMGTKGSPLKIGTLAARLDTSTAPATLDIDVIAATTEGLRETRQWSTTERVELIPQDRLAIETHSLRFVTLKETVQGGSLWSEVLEPVLVVLAAGAIVALFFLIRS